MTRAIGSTVTTRRSLLLLRNPLLEEVQEVTPTAMVKTVMELKMMVMMEMMANMRIRWMRMRMRMETTRRMRAMRLKMTKMTELGTEKSQWSQQCRCHQINMVGGFTGSSGMVVTTSTMSVFRGCSMVTTATDVWEWSTTQSSGHMITSVISRGFMWGFVCQMSGSILPGG